VDRIRRSHGLDVAFANRSQGFEGGVMKMGSQKYAGPPVRV
jgi:hypothetical protein